MRKKKYLVGALVATVVLPGVNTVQLDASEIKGELQESIVKEARKTDNSTYGWSHGSMGYCDQNGYDVFYSQNTAAGGYTYQQAWIDPDVYPKSTVTKKNATAKATRGAKNNYYYGFKDYN